MAVSKATSSVLAVIVVVCFLIGATIAADAPAPAPASSAGSISPSFAAGCAATYTRDGEEYAGTPEAARSMLVHRRKRGIFWPSGTSERIESIGVLGGSQESSMVQKKEDSGEGNEAGEGQGAGVSAYDFWISGGWRRKRRNGGSNNFLRRLGHFTVKMVADSHDELKGFNMLSLNEFGGSDDKWVSRRVYNTNEYKYKGSPDHLAFF
ncbi:hypothetical protein H5410_041910 [Solanum commersonii]|uniref:Uncharacterized protein n=1 Tax=Solanum commersonii TaxID=4109 RepID=A0A9J5XVZ3_SOLCO|nr:hypothetical protein H5410_041910 [Solanum commersonii]